MIRLEISALEVEPFKHRIVVDDHAHQVVKVRASNERVIIDTKSLAYMFDLEDMITVELESPDDNHPVRSLLPESLVRRQAARPPRPRGHCKRSGAASDRRSPVAVSGGGPVSLGSE